MGILVWIVCGLVVGVGARIFRLGREPIGFPLVAAIGSVGVVGALLQGAAGWSTEGETVGFLMAMVGTVGGLPLYRLLSQRSHRAAS